jgi:DNA-binding CsgD family transcriptional regulator
VSSSIVSSSVADQWRRVRLRLRSEALSNLPPGPLAARMMEALEEAIGWDGYRLFGVDPATLLINRLLAASDNDAWARREWLHHVYLTNERVPYIELPNVMRARLAAAAFQESQETSWGFPRELTESVAPSVHRQHYHESGSPVGGVLLAGFSRHDRWIAILQAYRRDHGCHFRPEHVALLRAASAIVGEGLGRALEREAARLGAEPSAGEPAGSGFLMIGSQGDVELATPAGQAWLDVLHGLDASPTGELPMAAHAVIRGYQQHERGFPMSVTVATGGRTIRIEASAGSGEGAIGLVIVPERRITPPSVPEAWGLTAQQQGVVMQVLSGKSNVEIAASLFISENTVEWHLRQIFNRLDVRSRTQLMARFFREALAADYREEDAAIDR